MKPGYMKGFGAFVLAIAFFVSIASACTGNVQETAAVQDKNNTSQTSSAPTTEKQTVTQTTTEDENTTFAEAKTNKIYDGLKKDEKGDYPYLLAEYITYYNSSDKSRTANLQAAVDKVDNIKIPKEKVFSFNQTVGKRTVTAGYETAKVINNGEFVDGLGGGVCQVSSTIFECVLRADMEIVYRTNHSLAISYVPMGGDATVQWNSKDFQFKNTTGTDVRISMKCDSGKLRCQVYGKKDVETGDVKINITNNKGTYTLIRTVDGIENYRTSSVYKPAKH